MDKRTILFVLALSLSLFLVNIFFQYQNVQKKQEWVKQQQQKKEAQKEIKPQENAALPASLRPTKKGEEKFYVLETPYQQLVFSTSGGALAEINLPFQTKENQLSVVREIEFDREMIKSHPDNAYFPAHPYYTPSASSTEEPLLHEKGKLGGYYPLLRRDLIETPPKQSIKIKPQYYALNIVSEYPELAEMAYEVKKFDSQSITFEAVQSHRRITKTYSLGEAIHPEGPYCLNLEIQIEGDGKGLWLTSGIPEVEWISGGIAPSLKYRLTRNQKSEVEKIDLPKEAATVNSVYLDWICNSNGFLGMILDPLERNRSRLQSPNGRWNSRSFPADGIRSKQ